MSSRISLMDGRIGRLSIEEPLQTMQGFNTSGGHRQHVVMDIDKLAKVSRCDQ